MNLLEILQKSSNIKTASECLNNGVRLSLFGLNSGEKVCFYTT